MTHPKISKKGIARYYDGIKLPLRSRHPNNFVKHIVIPEIVKLRNSQSSESPCFKLQSRGACRAFLFESTILFEKSLSNFMGAKHSFRGGYLQPGFLLYYYADLYAIMGISHVLGHGLYKMEDKREDIKLGYYYVKRDRTKIGIYTVKPKRSKAPMYRQNYLDFFELMRTLDEDDFNVREWDHLQKNEYTMFYEERDSYAYSLSAYTHYPSSQLIFNNLTEEECHENANHIFIDPYYDELADDVIVNEGDYDAYIDYVADTRTEGFLHEELAAYHLKILIDFLKEIAIYDHSNGMAEYLNNIRKRISSDRYQTHPFYITLLNQWLTL